MQKKKSAKLDSSIIPSEYDLKLHPDLLNFTFKGEEEIKIKILKPTKEITLHSKEIDIETASITVLAEKLFAEKISYDEKRETATFVFSKKIPAGTAKLRLIFQGILNDKMRGFYRSRYMLYGKERHMATTQFEATDARRAFPCFDEPAHRAVFKVSLVVEKGKTAISNTLPVSIKEHEAGFDIVRFSPTPKMSTYLLAFIVGDFDMLQTKTRRGVAVRVFTHPEKKHQAGFALSCAAKMLDFYEKYFDIKYPLPVLDMIAVPDFAAGAMENWGAITYRESALLFDEKNSSLTNKQRVALVVAHEIAHQWFGNLVTMEWWTHLWLNEGFASYMEYLALEKVFPEWNMWTQFSVQDLGVALRLDSLANTHPVEVKVHHPDEIGEIFDEVSYSKGACIIRMLAEYLGEKDFRDGLRYYLKKHSYKNTETAHLWQAFEKISGKPVKKIMQNWTAKPGYPVIKTEIKGESLYLSQGRFFSSPISKRKNKDKIIWQTPIVFGDGKNTAKILLSSQSTKLSLEALPPLGGKASKPEFVKINAGESGFFRVAYSKKMLDRLAKPVRDKKISARDRLGIIRDLFALAESGDGRTSEALKFLKAYKRESDYSVLHAIALGIRGIKQIFCKTGSEANLDGLIISLFSPVFRRLGWSKKKNEPPSDSMLRPLCIEILGQAGDEKTILKAKNLFAKIKKGKRVDPDLRAPIYGIVAKSGGIKEYEELIKMYKKEALHEERNRIGAALGNFSSPEILRKAAQFSLSSHVRPQDTSGIISSVGMNPLGRDAWLKCITRNWKTFVTRYGEGGHTLSRFMKAISGSAEERHLRKFKKFFRTHPAPGAERAVEQVIEKLESNILWLKRDKRDIHTYLSTLVD